MKLHELTDSNFKRAVVVITNSSFDIEYPLDSRSYIITNTNKYFNVKMCGTSLYGDSIDGTDTGVRLDLYIHDGWKIEDVYIIE